MCVVHKNTNDQVIEIVHCMVIEDLHIVLGAETVRTDATNAMII